MFPTGIISKCKQLWNGAVGSVIPPAGPVGPLMPREGKALSASTGQCVSHVYSFLASSSSLPLLAIYDVLADVAIFVAIGAVTSKS